MKRKIVQIMIAVIMLFCTAWTVGGRAPARQPNEPAQKEVVSQVVSERGRKHGHPVERPVVYPYPVATEVAYP